MDLMDLDLDLDPIHPSLTLIGVLKENRLDSINKEESLKNKLPKGDLRGAPANIFRVVSLSVKGEFILLSLSS